VVWRGVVKGRTQEKAVVYGVMGVQAARAVGVGAQCLGATRRLTGVGVGCITGAQPASSVRINVIPVAGESGKERRRGDGRRRLGSNEVSGESS
jgi:hypothetical protein